MVKILKFPDQISAKYDFKRAKRGKKRKKVDPEDYGQLNLFTGRNPQIFKLPSNLSHFEEALMLDEQGDARAKEAYLNAISHGDSLADANCNLGILESREGNYSRAFDLFTKSLKDDPRHFESHYNLGNLYLETGDYRLSKLHYEIAAEICPTFPNVFFNLGLALALNEEFQAAINAMVKYKELVPQAEGAKAEELIRSLEETLVTL